MLRILLYTFAVLLILFKYETIFKVRVFPEAVVRWILALEGNAVIPPNMTAGELLITGMFIDLAAHASSPLGVLGATAGWLATGFTPLAFANSLFHAHATNGPFVTGAFLEGAARLEANYDAIRAETEAMLQAQTITCFKDQLSNVTHLQNKNESCWKWFSIKDHRGVSDEARRRFPVTLGLLEGDDVVSASISVLEPHTSLKPHVGYYKGIYRYHLGLIVPDGEPRAHLICGGQRYEWRERQGVMFDDMFVHEAHNPTDRRRVVLFVDVRRHDLPPWLDALNRAILKVALGALANQDRQRHASVKSSSVVL